MFFYIFCAKRKQMKPVRLFICIIAVAFIYCVQIYAHGVECSINTGAKSVKSQYDDGAPMSYADVKIFTPEGKEFQSGVTDKNGIFSFVPDSKGTWKIKIDDGMGHRIDKTIKINADFKILENNFAKLPKLSTGYPQSLGSLELSTAY